MAFISAKNAKVRINSATHKAKEWRAKYSLQEENDTSNFEGAGFTDREAGLRDCEITVIADYDYGTAPMSVIYNGATLTNVILYLNDTTGASVTLPSALVTEVEVVAQVKNMVTIQFTAKNKGTFSVPTS